MGKRKTEERERERDPDILNIFLIFYTIYWYLSHIYLYFSNIFQIYFLI